MIDNTQRGAQQSQVSPQSDTGYYNQYIKAGIKFQGIMNNSVKYNIMIIGVYDTGYIGIRIPSNNDIIITTVALFTTWCAKQYINKNRSGQFVWNFSSFPIVDGKNENALASVLG